MKRGGPLRRRSILRRSGSLSRVLGRVPLDPRLRSSVWERSRGRCDWCGQPMREDRWECHHRQLRSQGGPDSPANLLALHPICHHREVHGHPTRSYRLGFLVPATRDPESWPVLRHSRRWQQPTADGWVGTQPHPDQTTDVPGGAA